VMTVGQSNSNYPLLGNFNSVTQTISYEVSLAILLHFAFCSVVITWSICITISFICG
jgi:NADH:ubiquinone oxidoreductase subunit H